MRRIPLGARIAAAALLAAALLVGVIVAVATLLSVAIIACWSIERLYLALLPLAPIAGSGSSGRLALAARPGTNDIDIATTAHPKYSMTYKPAPLQSAQ